MRVRQHVNPNALHFEAFRGRVPAIPAGAELEVEIGCADAQFLFERAAQDASRIYVGLEIREDFIALIEKKARQDKLPVHGVFCHAQLHMSEIFPAGRVDRVYINFPDPWFKRKHHDRRMIDETLAAAVAEAARPGAEIFVQTDVWDLAIDALSVFERDGRFTNTAGEWTFWRHGNPYGVRSWREANAEEHGLPIWRMMFCRD